MKTLFFLIFLAVSNASYAGPRSDGGTDRLVEYFSAVANDVLANVYFEPADRALIETSLADSEIISVRELIDPRTGQVLTSPQLVAWGSPGKIQLKQASLDAPDAESFEKLVNNKSAMAHIVVHELIRSSGNAGDNNFQISIGKYHLDQRPAKDYSIPLTNSPQKQPKSKSFLARLNRDCFASTNVGVETRRFFVRYDTLFLVKWSSEEGIDGILMSWKFDYGKQASVRLPTFCTFDKILDPTEAYKTIVSWGFETASAYNDEWESVMKYMRHEGTCKPKAKVEFHTFDYSKDYEINLSIDAFLDHIYSRLGNMREQYLADYDRLYRLGLCDHSQSQVGL